MSTLSQLHNDARIWIFALDKEPTNEQRALISSGLEAILSTWKAHGTPVRGYSEIAADRFIVVGADETETGASGCSIDSLHRSVRELVQRTGLNLSNHDAIFFRLDGKVAAASRPEFGELVRSGKIGPNTMVFDNSITTAGQLNGGRWELPFSASWHSKAF